MNQVRFLPKNPSTLAEEIANAELLIVEIEEAITRSSGAVRLVNESQLKDARERLRELLGQSELDT